MVAQDTRATVDTYSLQLVISVGKVFRTYFLDHQNLEISSTDLPNDSGRSHQTRVSNASLDFSCLQLENEPCNSNGFGW